MINCSTIPVQFLITRDIPKPRTLEEVKHDNMLDKVKEHIKDKRTIFDEYKLIKSKQSDLSKNMRDFVVGLIEEEE